LSKLFARKDNGKSQILSAMLFDRWQEGRNPVLIPVILLKGEPSGSANHDGENSPSTNTKGSVIAAAWVQRYALEVNGYDGLAIWTGMS
jgi:hypothetical protein